MPFNTYDFEKITVSTTALGLTSAKVEGSGGSPAQKANIVVSDADIMYREDGGTPTATTGSWVAAGQELILHETNNIRNFKAIRKDGTDATISIHYGR